MKIYKVKVNGKVYEVELESVTESSGTIVSEKKADAPVKMVLKEEFEVPEEKTDGPLRCERHFQQRKLEIQQHLS